MKNDPRNLSDPHADGNAALRRQRLGQDGRVIWLTGLSGSGKTTIAEALETALLTQGRACCILDGDQLRHGLNRDLGFSDADRHENVRRAGEVAALMARAGLIVIASFISPFRADRAAARAACPPGLFLEVHLDTPLAVCEGRDPKGLYKKARAGLIPSFTGIDSPYEAPEDPEIRLATGDQPLAACIDRLLERLTVPQTCTSSAGCRPGAR